MTVSIRLFLVLILFTMPFLANASTSNETLSCAIVSGTWYSDIKARSNNGIVRHISKIKRHDDSSLEIKGVSLHLDTNNATPWEINGSWKCKDALLIQRNEDGSKKYQIKQKEGNKIILIDQENGSTLTEQRSSPEAHELVLKFIES